MHRVYFSYFDFSSDNIIITDIKELHHLSHVLRIQKGDEVTVFDGKGVEILGVIEQISSRKSQIRVKSVKKEVRHKPSIILACAIPKKTKFEMIIEKATELGVDEIVPLKTKRTEINLRGDRLGKKQKRYQTVALNAAKQSGRLFLPDIAPVTDFSMALADLKARSEVVIPSLCGERENLIKTLELMSMPQCIAFFIGPEGDFTPDEYSQAKDAGCLPVTLGKTILKVETAAICALSCASLFFHSPKH